MATIHILISRNSPNLETLAVVEERPKSLRVRSEFGHECFLPKSGIELRKPGVPTYENEFVLSAWFRSKLSYQQERVLGISE